MHKVISFDLWDTIIKRKCHPEEIKLYVSNYIFIKYGSNIKEEYKDIYKILKKRNDIEALHCENNQKQGNDAECRILEVFDALNETIMIEKVENLSEELLKVEIEHEKSMIYLNPEITKIFDKHKDLKKYIISDFYMSADSLKELLDSIPVKIKFEKIYSSADLLLNKRSGRLYEKFEKDVNIKPSEHIHVGDNEYSDIQNAKKLGIETIRIYKEDHFDFACKRNRNFNFDFESAKIKNVTKKADTLFNLGVEMSPIMYFFAQDIINHALKNNIDKVYYMTREGEVFIKAHELIYKNNPFGVKLPEYEILEVSRMATFAASLKEFSSGELLRLWSQYRDQSLNALFKTLNIDIKKYSSYIEKYGIEADKFEKEPWFDVKKQSLFNDYEFVNEMNAELAIKKNNLLNYFDKKGIKNDASPLFVVDIGWRGTIQDNIAYIYKEKQVDGFYYTLFDYFNPQPRNTNKFAFIKDTKFRDEVFTNLITLFEMLFNPESGSVVEYKDGVAVRKSKENEVNLVKNFTSHIQRGMLEGSRVINEYLTAHPYEMSEFEDYIKDIISNIKTNPSKDLVEIYYSLVHNDTFGTGEYVKKEIDITPLDKINFIKMRNKINAEGWREAYIIHNDIEYVAKLMKTGRTFKKIVKKAIKKGE